MTSHCVRAIRFPARMNVLALQVSAALLMASADAGTQELPATDEEPSTDPKAQLDEVVVTGSHIKRIDIEGPLPISVITREELLARGEPSVSDAIRDLPYNSFGSEADLPNSTTPTQSLPALRGLGSKYTLTLLDGHRLPGYANSNGGAAASLTGIPIAAIDRVEVLREGASAVYGSDAIGGVINLLTRRDDTAPEIEIQVEYPEQDGGETHRASLVYGRSFERGHWLVAAEYQDREPLLGRDRDYLLALAGLSQNGNPGTFRRIDPDTEDFVGPFTADARCPAATDSDPVFASSQLQQFGANTVCGYRFRDLNAERAGFTGRSLFSTGRYQFSDQLSGYGRMLLIEGDSLTQLAPTPVPGIIIAADNPFNPTRGELGPELGYPLFLLYRLAALGPRVNEIEERSLHALVGIDGMHDWGAGGDWDLSVSHNRYDHEAVGVSGYGLRRNFQAALDSARFNPFESAPGDLAGLENVGYQPYERSQTRISGIELAASVDGGFWFDLAASYAFGLDLRRAEYALGTDAEQRLGQVLGQGGFAEPESASRSYGGVYGELLLPVGERLELSAAARFDRYQDAGSALSPKLAFSYRPSADWLLRGSAGKGFQAPDLVSAYGGFATFETTAIDEIDCALHPDDPIACEERPIEFNIVPNAELGPERARQGSLGVVWQPSTDIEFALDYYQTHIQDQIGGLDAETILLLELDCSESGRVCDPVRDGQVIRDALGNLQSIIAPRINIASVKTRGLDLEMSARRATAYGNFRLDLRASKVLDLDVEISPYADGFGIVGAFGAPPWRANARLSWEYGNHGLSVGAEYIADKGQCAPATFADGSPNPDCEDRIAAYAEFDAQWRWKTPWGSELAVGGRNLGNRAPPHDFSGGYQYGLYDPNGRVWYMRFSQGF